MIATGNHAVAYGVRSARAEVVAAYPITPQTQIVEKLSEFMASGEMRGRYIRVESEHSALSACYGAAACGARAFTATSSQGLLYMNEMVFWTGLGRIPMVMAVVNRTLAPPWSIWNEHTDQLAQRDAGWISMICESVQEAYDTSIMAFRVAEDAEVMQPVMFGLDAFSLSHTAERLDIMPQEDADEFLPRLDPSMLPVLMDTRSPATYGNLTGPDAMMEVRSAIRDAFERSKRVIEEAAGAFGRASGRRQAGLVEDYRCGDAEVVIVVAGASSGDAKDAADALRDQGTRAGVLRMKAVRPFPSEAISRAVGGAKAVAVVDRDYSFGMGGILATEVASVVGGRAARYVAGLGGRDIRPEDFRGRAADALRAGAGGDPAPGRGVGGGRRRGAPGGQGGA